MTAVTLPVLDCTDGGFDGADHLYCCIRGLSLCGLDISGLAVLPAVDDEDGDIEVCPVCRAAADGPCGAKRCPYRRRWWQWW